MQSLQNLFQINVTSNIGTVPQITLLQRENFLFSLKSEQKSCIQDKQMILKIFLSLYFQVEHIVCKVYNHRYYYSEASQHKQSYKLLISKITEVVYDYDKLFYSHEVQ